jgi:predicted transcriptional regulator
MDFQNITLSLPKDLLQKVKLVAVQQETSVSRLMTQLLEEMVDRETGYRAAKEQSLALLEQGFDLNTDGVPNWRREELHER